MLTQNIHKLFFKKKIKNQIKNKDNNELKFYFIILQEMANFPFPSIFKVMYKSYHQNI